MVSSDYPGDEIKINVDIKEFLKIIREKYVNQYINNYNLTDIKWVITVPPLWDIKGKKLMQEQAKNAGMVNLDVVLEPEAASLALFYEDNPTIKKYVQPGKKFLIFYFYINNFKHFQIIFIIIVDAGAYTVDFSANKILEKNTLEQLIVPISIVNGSSILNDKIFDFVKKFIGEDKIKSAKFTYIKTILNEIEDMKRYLNIIESENLELNIVGLGVTCSTGGVFSWSKNKECEKEIEGKKIFYTDKILFIPKEYVNEIILEMTITIKHIIDSILVKMKSTDLIIFTGGFSYNEIFREKMKEFLEEISAVAFMKEPQESVMKGAALFGLKPTQIVRRIIPVTIGIESYEKKESEDSICEGEYIDEKNETRCQKFIIYSLKRQSIEANEIINHNIHHN